MNESKVARKAHSEEYFGESRDYWWNLDFLKLMGDRLKFDEVRTVLDVGCGIGHWGQILAHVFRPEVSVVGIDTEASSLAKAEERARQRGLEASHRYQPGDATSIPFSSNSFDMVTCQTLLIHLKEPKVGLQEMLRVLKPGGLLLVVEPNNFSNRAVMSTLTVGLSVDEVLDRMKFQLIIERGKRAMGLGYNSEGDLIPRYLANLQTQDIQVFLSDKAAPLFAPYDSEEQQVNIRQMREWLAREFVGWEKAEMQSYYLAGGGQPEEFERFWHQGLQDAKQTVQGIDAGNYYSAGGMITYLISARKK